MDLGIGEFHAVGETIKQFASDEATVVIGTVIDPEMSNEIRVTVVATGLGKGASEKHESPRLVKPTRRERPNFAELERPAVQRVRAVGDGLNGPDEIGNLLDIPAFLRRQAD